jgi:thymidylate synthase ThyX
MAIVQTPHRFRTKRPLWKYVGFGVVTHSSADPRYVEGQLQRSKKSVSVRGLDFSHNHYLKDLFKSAAIQASTQEGPLREFYEALVGKGMRPEMARLTLARKIVTIAFTVWKKGVVFDAKYLKPQTA